MKGKKILSLITAAVLFSAVIITTAACGRAAKYRDALTIASQSLPSNLMPYDSNASTSMLIAGNMYDTILGSEITPAGYEEGKDYLFSDGSKFAPVNKTDNPYLFTDLLFKKEGAYPAVTDEPNEDGYIIGRTDYEPTSAEITSFERRRKKQPSSVWHKYTFEVVQGHTWNDGTPFTAADVVHTFTYIMLHSGAFGAQAAFLTNYSHSVASEDGKYLEIYLGAQKASDIKTICNSIFILPRHIWEDIKEPRREKNTANPVGTGAYKLASYIEGSSITITQREDYAFKNELNPDLKNITVKYIGTPELMLSALQKGDIDLIYDDISPLKANQIQTSGGKSFSNVKISSVQSEFATTLLFNVRDDSKGYFANSNFGGKGDILRQAISLAIDQQELIDTVLFSNGSKVGGGLVLSNQPHALFYNGIYDEKEFDIAKANKMLDEAGFTKSGDIRKSPSGESLAFKILASANSERLVQNLKTQLKKIGVDISYEPSDNQYSENIKYSQGSKFQMIINSVTFSADKLLMFDARYGVYSEDTGEEDFEYVPRMFNYSGILNKQLRDLILEMDNEPNVNNQIEKAKDVQEYLKELYIEIPLYASNKVTAYSERNFNGWIAAEGQSIFNSFSTKYLTKAK